MPNPLAIMAGFQIAGSVLGFAGQREADAAQARAERQNAEFFEMQKRYAKYQMDRELDIYSREADDYVGAQTTNLFQSNVQFAGTALTAVTQTKTDIEAEKGAIRLAADTQIRLAGMRALQANDTARELTSKSREMKQLFGTIFNIGGSVAQAKGFSSLESNVERPTVRPPADQLIREGTKRRNIASVGGATQSSRGIFLTGEEGRARGFLRGTLIGS